MKYLGLTFFIFCFSTAFAQKMNCYSAFVSGTSIELIFNQQENGQLQGYYLNYSNREKHPISGQYHSLGNYWTLYAQGSSLFRFLLIRESLVSGQMKGIYYGKRRGHFDLKKQPVDRTHKAHLSINAINDLYRQVHKDFEQDFCRPYLPFKGDGITGFQYLDADASCYLDNGLVLGPRKMLFFKNTSIGFTDYHLETELCSEQKNWYFQIITYHPETIMLVVLESTQLAAPSEHAESARSKYFFGLYQKTEKVWTNITNSRLDEQAMTRMQRKSRDIKVEHTSNYFTLTSTNSIGKLNINSPKTMLFIPDLKQPSGSSTYQWQWKDKGFLYID